MPPPRKRSENPSQMPLPSFDCEMPALDWCPIASWPIPPHAPEPMPPPELKPAHAPAPVIITASPFAALSALKRRLHDGSRPCRNFDLP